MNFSRDKSFTGKNKKGEAGEEDVPQTSQKFGTRLNCALK
jgi:hypothetical protein